MKTLGKITACDPGPEEILVHVDGGTPEVVQMLREKFPQVQLLTSTELLGPGGARNRLVDAARHELIANFDDDSFPEHPDYFSLVMEGCRLFPQAAIISAANHDDEPCPHRFMQISMASGCGCVFRKSWYLKAAGFVPLPIAYNMEEIDMGLKLFAQGGTIVQDARLTVVHDKPPVALITADLNSAILANTALFAFLRFPIFLWPLGAWQLVSRLIYAIRRGWTQGLVHGLDMIPSHLWRHRGWRAPVAASLIFRWHALRRYPRKVHPASVPE